MEDTNMTTHTSFSKRAAEILERAAGESEGGVSLATIGHMANDIAHNMFSLRDYGMNPNDIIELVDLIVAEFENTNKLQP
jgi:hypothetical protein